MIILIGMCRLIVWLAVNAHKNLLDFLLKPADELFPSEYDCRQEWVLHNFFSKQKLFWEVTTSLIPHQCRYEGQEDVVWWGGILEGQPGCWQFKIDKLPCATSKTISDQITFYSHSCTYWEWPGLVNYLLQVSVSLYSHCDTRRLCIPWWVIDWPMEMGPFWTSQLCICFSSCGSSRLSLMYTEMSCK